MKKLTTAVIAFAFMFIAANSDAMAEQPKTLADCKVAAVIFGSQRAFDVTTRQVFDTAGNVSDKFYNQHGEFRIIDVATTAERGALMRTSRVFSRTTLTEAGEEANPEMYLLKMWASNRVKYATNLTGTLKQFEKVGVIIMDVDVANLLDPVLLERIFLTHSDSTFAILGDNAVQRLSKPAGNIIYSAIAAYGVLVRAQDSEGNIVDL